MLRSHILLIYCIWAAEASVSGDIVDFCDYSSLKTRCGDTCINYDQVCDCGGELLNTDTGPNHCCMDDSDDLSFNSSVNTNLTIWFQKQCEYFDDIGAIAAICPQGRVLNNTETCNNLCFNDYYASSWFGYDSQFRCGNTCVPVYKMCQGYSMCEDRSDVRACDETLTCVWGRGYTDRRQMDADLSNNHFYCGYGDLKNDGEYNTITRVDETDLDIRKQKVRIDFSSLDPCLYNGTDPGLKCGEECYLNYDWCLEDYSQSCDVTGGQFTTNNRALCGNTTFWINQTCDKFYSLGLRCSGGAQHCYYPWYLSSISGYEVS